MVDEKLLQLARAIYEKTKAGEIRWQPTSHEDRFAASFPKYSVIVSEVTPLAHMLSIYNQQGQLIEQLWEQQARESGFSEMSELFGLARRQAMGVEQALDELLGELGSSTRK